MPESLEYRPPEESDSQEVISIPEIDNLREPLKRVFHDLIPEIESGQYQVVIGDDASGRIPTLILDRAINTIYEEKGVQPPKLLFSSGSRMLNTENESIIRGRKESLAKFAQFVKRIIDKLPDADRDMKPVVEGQKGAPASFKTEQELMDMFSERIGESDDHDPTPILFVTEYIGRGKTIEDLGFYLHALGLRMDIAAVSVTSEPKIGVRRVVSGRSEAPPNIMSRAHLSGVVKATSQPFARRAKSQSENPYTWSPSQVQEARRQSNMIADQLVDDYHKHLDERQDAELPEKEI